VRAQYFLVSISMKKNLRTRALALPALSVLSMLCLSAYAETSNVIDSEVVITSTRRALPTDQVIQSVSVITRQDIEQTGAQSLMDLLAVLPGVHTARSGGPGKATSVYVRGTTTNQLLVLVNGVRASSSGTGEFDWNAITPDQIEKIEVVRGPMASLYGSDAMGGVVQIFTRESQKGATVSQTFGSYGTRQTDVAYGGSNDDWTYGWRVGERSIHGMQTVVTKPNRFGSYQKYVDGTLSKKIDKTTNVQLGLNYSDGHNDDEYGQNLSRTYNSYARVEHETSDTWRQVLQLSAFGANLKVPQGYPPGEFDTQRAALSWLNVLNLSSGVMSLGAESWVDRVTKLDYSDSSNNVHKDLITQAIYGQYANTWQGVDWQLGARHDHHNVYGDQSTFNAGLGKRITPQLQLVSSYGTAFKAPTANDLYWPHSVEPNTDASYNNLSFAGGTCGPTVMTWGAPTPCIYDTVGNTNLKPEKSKTAEVGLRYADGYNLKLNYFETQISDLISWKSALQGQGDLYGAYYQPQNISSAKIRGLEAGISQRVADWYVSAQYTHLLATNEDTGLQLDRRPKQSGALTVSKDIQKHKISGSLQMVSERLDSSGNIKLAGYSLLNVADLYRINSDWSVLTRIENMLDKKYTLATSFGTPYATPGRSLYVTLRYTYK
jgi:vitamin B12 transporter